MSENGSVLEQVFDNRTPRRKKICVGEFVSERFVSGEFVSGKGIDVAVVVFVAVLGGLTFEAG